MAQISISVVVVSRGRPGSLRMCLIGLSRLFHRCFEIIVVADPDGVEAAHALPFAADLRVIPYDTPNISAARNLGIAAAAGEVVAFIDDDAVPEPAWLDHLGDAFRDARVAAAGGFVIGRNGISWQWRARWIDPGGQAHALEVDQTLPTVLHPRPGRAIKTEGTNMAVRRWVLKKMGGFDESFRFYMDETDLNMRLAQMDLATAIVPRAVVHHAYAPSVRRQRNRAVLDLSDVGRSSALFWRKHAPRHAWPHHETTLRAEQRRRLMTQMRDGLLEPRDARRALKTLDSGLKQGLKAPFDPPAQIPRRQDVFHRFPVQVSGRTDTLVCSPWRRRQTLLKARDMARSGVTVSVFCLSATAIFHTVKFLEGGVWLQTGGLFGKSTRSDPLVRLTTRASRARREWERVKPFRGPINK